MDKVKRKSTLNRSSKKKTKKLRNEFNRSITSIENLSNELFYEIFDYLEGRHIYNAFSNLNHYFQKLLDSSSCLFKVIFNTLDYDIWNKYTEYKKLLINTNKIFSMKITLPLEENRFFSSFIIDSSFNRLESLFLDDIKSDLLISLLISLARLPRLFSLTIDVWDGDEHVNEIYQLIIALPTLKYNRLSLPGHNHTISLPIATSQQFSSIEHLVIGYRCTFNEIFAITSYTPQLRRLKLMEIHDKNPNIGTISLTGLLNITHLSIDIQHVKFDEFEIFIRKINSKLKVLSTRCRNITFFDANRWEKLILQYLPQLQKFRLEYCALHACLEYEDNEDKYPIYSGEPNKFSSSFWIERQCMLEAEIHGLMIKYLVRRYKTMWYESPQAKVDNSSIELSKSIRINNVNMHPNHWHDTIIKDIRSILSVTQIYHLEILEQELFIGSLIRTINLLPKLNTLKIHYLSLDQPRKAVSAIPVGLKCETRKSCSSDNERVLRV